MASTNQPAHCYPHHKTPVFFASLHDRIHAEVWVPNGSVMSACILIARRRPELRVQEICTMATLDAP